MRNVDEEQHGLYMWVDGQGRRIADSDGNTMNMPGKKGDPRIIEAMRQAARYYGVMDGKAVFLPGRRRVTSEEYDYQQERLRAGLVPDPLDFRAMEEEVKYAKQRGQ